MIRNLSRNLKKTSRMQEVTRIKKRIQIISDYLRLVFLCISKILYNQILKKMISYIMLFQRFR